MTDNVELKTERLLLRPFRLADVDDVYAYARDPDWARFLLPMIPQPYTRRNAEEFIAGRVAASWSTDSAFAIVLDSVVVGGINLHINERHETGELGYSLARVHWGKGLTTQAATAVVDWGFSELGLAKVYASADLRNAGSWRIMEKVGMTREGVLRSHTKTRDGRADQVFYGVLRAEWETSSAREHQGSRPPTLRR